MKAFIINVHSLVDLITNSSSEIFVCANNKSVETIKQLIDAILILGDSKLKCDDLFDINLIVDQINIEDKYLCNIRLDDPKYGDDIREKIEESEENGERYFNVLIDVKSKINNDSPQMKTVIELLSKINTIVPTEEHRG